MTTRLLLLTVCIVLCSTVWMGPIAGTMSATTFGRHSNTSSPPPVFECGGEPCDAVLRGLRAFLDRTPRSEERAALLAYLRKL